MRLYVNLKNGKTFDYRLPTGIDYDLLDIVHRAQMIHDNWSSMIITLIRREPHEDTVFPETPDMDGNGGD